MKVLDLRCAQGHGFEGWFGSDDEFTEQLAAGRLECPMCASREVARMPSAPRLNLSGAAAAEPTPDTSAESAWLRTVRALMASTEDVGERFADEARAIHYGEAKARGIRGQASDDQRAALQDEGIEFATIPVPAALKGPVQ